MSPILYTIRAIHNIIMKSLRRADFNKAVELYLDGCGEDIRLIEEIRLVNFRNLLMNEVTSPEDISVFSRNCVKFLTKSADRSEITEILARCITDGSWEDFELSYRKEYSDMLGYDVTHSYAYNLDDLLPRGSALKDLWKEDSNNFSRLLIHTNSFEYPYGFISPACPMTVAEKIDVLGDAKTILKSGPYYGLCIVLTEALQCRPKFYYHMGIKPLLPNVPALLSYYFPEFNKDRFVPSGISYDGYWWDKYDTDTRMKVLCELTDIYKEKLVRRSGPGEDELSE